MATLTITAKGQVTFRKELLQHLGIEPGQKLEIDKLPDGRIELKAVRPSKTIDAFIGRHAGKVKKPISIEEMNEIAVGGWAGER